MEYRFLGHTGLRVSELCLGAMTFGRQDEATEEESHAMLDRFVAVGGNFIDTANVYSTGISEEIVGKWLHRQRRDDLVIATKVRFPMGTGPNDLGVSRKHILSSVEASLKRLQTDYIDLYQVHCWDPATPIRGNPFHPERSGPSRSRALSRGQQFYWLAVAAGHRS